MNDFYTHATPLPTPTEPDNYTPSNEQAAWLAIAYTAACWHEPISQDAREAFCRLIASKELYRGHEILDYFFELLAVKDHLKPHEIIRLAAKQVSPEHAPTLFSIVTETLLTKGYLNPEEEDLLAYIGQQLQLDPALTDKITEVLLLKNKWNCNFN